MKLFLYLVKKTLIIRQDNEAELTKRTKFQKPNYSIARNLRTVF